MMMALTVCLALALVLAAVLAITLPRRVALLLAEQARRDVHARILRAASAEVTIAVTLLRAVLDEVADRRWGIGGQAGIHPQSAPRADSASVETTRRPDRVPSSRERPVARPSTISPAHPQAAPNPGLPEPPAARDADPTLPCMPALAVPILRPTVPIAIESAPSNDAG